MKTEEVKVKVEKATEEKTEVEQLKNEMSDLKLLLKRMINEQHPASATPSTPSATLTPTPAPTSTAANSLAPTLSKATLQPALSVSRVALGNTSDFSLSLPFSQAVEINHIFFYCYFN